MGCCCPGMGNPPEPAEPPVREYLRFNQYSVPLLSPQPYMDGEEAEERVQINVLHPNGAQRSHQMHPNDTVLQLKINLFHQASPRIPPPCSLGLLFSGVELQDQDTLAQHGIHDAAVCELVCPDPMPLEIDTQNLQDQNWRNLRNISYEWKDIEAWPEESLGGMLTRVLYPLVGDDEADQLLRRTWFWEGNTQLPRDGPTLKVLGVVPGTRLHTRSRSRQPKRRQKTGPGQSVGGTRSQCRNCDAVFPSRTRLFAHLRTEHQIALAR
eukprot:TRINITY_DN27091_c0_g1_i1.p1 TRINITY_DN27091_c0_g1~~TRINITY_DN27091_c0_g1_i1.p1  ORF type:complete len:267 (+),score=35.72 TRINITY_DN27091_c0_g1_i1:160-960(+)